MSLFRKVELVEQMYSSTKPEEKMDLENEEKIDDLRINENIIKIIENIVEKYLQRKSIKPKFKVKKPKKKIQNGGNIKWIYK